MKKVSFTILAVLFLLLSATSLIQAKQLIVWKLSILATEYGHFIGTLCVALAAATFMFARVPAAILILSAVLFFRPAVLAFAGDKRWANDLQKNLGAANPGPLLSAKQLWKFNQGTMIEPERRVFSESPEKLVLDFYRTECSDPVPWILVVHGGGWDSGDQNQFRAFNSRLAHRGYSVVAMSYRLAPRWKWPAQKEDVLAAVKYVKENAAELNVDPEQWALVGRSAGGQIAQSIAYQTKPAGLKGIVAFYTPADLNFSYQFTVDNDIINSRQLLINLLGGKPGEVPQAYNDASPIEFAGKDSTPSLLLHGGNDPLTWVLQSRRLMEKLAGGRAAYIELPWATHAFDFNLNGPGGQIAATAVDRFFDAILNKRGET